MVYQGLGGGGDEAVEDIGEGASGDHERREGAGSLEVEASDEVEDGEVEGATPYSTCTGEGGSYEGEDAGSETCYGSLHFWLQMFLRRGGMSLYTDKHMHTDI